MFKLVRKLSFCVMNIIYSPRVAGGGLKSPRRLQTLTVWGVLWQLQALSTDSSGRPVRHVVMRAKLKLSNLCDHRQNELFGPMTAWALLSRGVWVWVWGHRNKSDLKSYVLMYGLIWRVILFIREAWCSSDVGWPKERVGSVSCGSGRETCSVTTPCKVKGVVQDGARAAGTISVCAAETKHQPHFRVINNWDSVCLHFEVMDPVLRAGRQSV